MSMPMDDPLDPKTVGRGGVERDQYDRAMLIPPEGGARRPYTSMSTLAKQLGSDYALHQWELIMVAKGVGMSRELAGIAGSSRYDTRIGEEDEGRNREERAVMLEVVRDAKELAGAHQKAKWGTTVHRYVEQEDPLGEPPKDMAGDIEAIRRMFSLLGIKLLATELFVVNEELGAAGSFDYAMWVPWLQRLVIGDLKTGSLHLDQDEIQIAGYAGSVIYDRETDERITFTDAFGMEVDQEIGYTVSCRPMSQEPQMYPLDLKHGRKSALLARDVHARNSAARKLYGKKACPPLDVEAIARDRARAAIEEVRTDDVLTFAEVSANLKRIHAEYRTVWTEELSTIGREILRERKTMMAA